MSLAASAKAAKASYDAKEWSAVITSCRDALISEGLLEKPVAPAPVVATPTSATPAPAKTASTVAAKTVTPAKTATPAKGVPAKSTSTAPGKSAAKTAPPAKITAQTILGKAPPPAKAAVAAPPPKVIDYEKIFSTMEEKKKTSIYMIYVMAGAASFQQGASSYTDCESYYTRAIQVNATAPQAWKGLHELHSATANTTKLLPVLTELVKNKTDKKWGQYVRELATAIETTTKEWSRARDLWTQYQTYVTEQKENTADIDYTIISHMTICNEGMENDERTKELAIRIERQIKKARSERESGGNSSSSSNNNNNSDSKEDLSPEAEEWSIKQRVTVKLDSQLLKSTELDDRYRSLAASPSCTDASQWWDRLLSRSVARLAALPESKEVYDGLITTLRNDCRTIITARPTYLLAYHTLAMIDLDVDMDPGTARQHTLDFFTSFTAAHSDHWLSKLAALMNQPTITAAISLATLRTLFVFTAAPSLTYVPPVAPVGTISFGSAAASITPVAVVEPAVPSQPASHSIAPSAPYLPTFIIWAVLARVHVSNGRYKDAIESVTSGLQWLAVHKSIYPHDHRHIKYKSHFQLTLAEAYVGDGFEAKLLDKATTMCDDVLKSSQTSCVHHRLRALQILAKIAQLQRPRTYEKARDYATSVQRAITDMKINIADDTSIGAIMAWSLSTLGWMDYKLRHKGASVTASLTSARQQLDAAIKLDSNSSLSYARLGRIQWAMGGEHKESNTGAYASFLRAAQLDATNSTAFTYLGHYSLLITKSKPKAKGCYLKALTSNAGNRQAGRALCGIYESDGLASELQLARAICVNAVTADPVAFWAWSRLGRYQRGAAEYADAVTSYQNALRGRPRDAAAWEELGEAYNAQGKYIAGLKAFTRAVELRPTHAARYQLASTQLLLGLRSEAVAGLRAMVVVPSSESKDGKDRFIENAFMPAVKMLADSLLALAQAQLNDGALKACAMTLQQCIATGEHAVATLAAESKRAASTDGSDVRLKAGSNGVVSVHKLLGDAYTMYRDIPQCLEITGKTPLAMMTSADAAYARAVEISPATASLWYDRAITAHAAANLAVASLTSGESKTAKATATSAVEWRNNAITYAQRAVTLESTNATYWNALGVVDNRPAMRHHAFIKAVKSDSKDAVGWANLGVFYLQHNARELSRESLENGQRLDPNLSMVWLGQALFNHSLGGYKEASAAFARALELTPSWSSRLGVGVTQWHQHQWYDAEYALRSALASTPNHPHVLNLYGLVCEQQNRLSDAITSLATAERVLSSSPSMAQSPASLRAVRINLARALVAAGRATDALPIYDALMKAEPSSIELRLWFATALLTVDQFTRADALLKDALAAAVVVGEPGAAATNNDVAANATRALRRHIQVQQAQSAIKQKVMRRAIDVLQISINELKDDPASDASDLWRATSLMFAISLSAGDYDTATNVLMACQSNPKSIINTTAAIMGAIQLAYTLVASAQGDSNRARRHLAKANHIAPYDVSTRLRLNEYVMGTSSAASATLRTVSAARPAGGVQGEDMALYQRRLNVLVRARLATGHIHDFEPTIDNEKRDATVIATADDDDAEFDGDQYDDENKVSGGRSRAPGAGLPFDDDGFANVTAGVVGRGARSLAARLVHLNPTANTNWNLLGSALHASAVTAPVYASPVLTHVPVTAAAPTPTPSVPATSPTAAAVTAAAAAAQSSVPIAAPRRVIPGVNDASTAIRILSLFIANNRSIAIADILPPTLALCDCYCLRASSTDIKEANQLLASLPAIPKDDVHSQALIIRQRARVALVSKDQPTAINLYRDALRLVPDHVGLWEELATIYYNQSAGANGAARVAVGDLCLRTALTALEKPVVAGAPVAPHWRYISRDSMECRLLLRLARSCYFSKRYPAGMTAAERAVTKTTTGSMSPTAYFIHALFLRKLRKWKEASAALNTALQLYGAASRTGASSHHGAPFGLHPPSVTGPSLIHMSLFHMYLREKDFANATTELLAERDIAPGLAPIYYHLAQLATKTGGTVDDARSLLKQAISLTPHYPLYQQALAQLVPADAADEYEGDEE